MDTAATRPWDVVLWGATGFTGRLVAEALAGGAPEGLRWALGGRDRERLERLRAGLGVDAGVVVADAHDPVSLAALARSARVVASTVGPYARHGTPLVAACVEAGTHYADLTGEVTWMRASIDAFHDAARASGAKIVHACGFDSVPSDLGVWWLQRHAVARHGRPCTSVVHGFGPMSGGVSGGTVASAIAMAEAAAVDAGVRRALADPDLLAPGGAP
ncbi:MAG: saccharopine dehydrogenase NADP-binding domain-containing protein, partial [Trueperaceae bacterium]